MLMFEKNLAIARKNKGITQIQLAKMLHVSNGTVGNWESGKRTPDIACVAKIASLLDVTTDFLLYGNVDNLTTNNSPESPEKEKPVVDEDDELEKDVNELVKMTKDFSEEEFKAVLDYVDYLVAKRKKQ